MSRVTPLLVGLVLSLACSTTREQASAPAESPAAAYLRDPAAVARGRSIFIGTCGAYCHSLQNVERDAPSLFDCEWRHGGSDEQVFATISNGVPNTRMPAFNGALPDGDADIWRVIAYLRSASVCKPGA